MKVHLILEYQPSGHSKVILLYSSRDKANERAYHLNKQIESLSKRRNVERNRYATYHVISKTLLGKLSNLPKYKQYNFHVHEITQSGRIINSSSNIVPIKRKRQ